MMQNKVITKKSEATFRFLGYIIFEFEFKKSAYLYTLDKQVKQKVKLFDCKTKKSNDDF